MQSAECRLKIDEFAGCRTQDSDGRTGLL